MEDIEFEFKQKLTCHNFKYTINCHGLGIYKKVEVNKLKLPNFCTSQNFFIKYLKFAS